MLVAALAVRVGPILVFLCAITVIAELADRVGLFSLVASQAARLARGSVLALWLLVVVVAVLCTAVLSLDTTAVLLTPVVLSLARRLELDNELFAYTSVWLANTASLWLPVSNLTNLLADSRLREAEVGFVFLMAPGAAAAVLVTVIVLATMFHRSLRGGYVPAPPEVVPDRLLLLVAAGCCVALGGVIVLGADVTVAAGIGAIVLLVAVAVRAPRLLGRRLVPSQLVLGVSVLFVVVEIAQQHGLSELLARIAGSGTAATDLLRFTGVSAASANAANNLPAYLALEPLAYAEPLRYAALLIGVNAGPLLLPWASLATLLWASRCRAAGVPVRWSRFVLRGVVLVPLVLVSCVAATCTLSVVG